MCPKIVTIDILFKIIPKGFAAAFFCPCKPNKAAAAAPPGRLGVICAGFGVVFIGLPSL